MLMGHNAMDNNIAGRVFLVTRVVSGYSSGGVRIQVRWCQDADQVVSDVRVVSGVM